MQGKPSEALDEPLPRLFALLDALGAVARRMHPPRLPQLVASIADPAADLRLALRQAQAASGPVPFGPVWQQVQLTATLALRACDDLRQAESADSPMLEAYRAMRQYSRALEALQGMAETVPSVGQYLLEPNLRDAPDVQARLSQAEPAHPAYADAGVFHVGNEVGSQGGYSVFVPPWYNAARAHPLVMALHGGSGHGRLFLWNWVPEARTRGLIVVAPTATGRTWSLMEPEIGSRNLAGILAQVRDRWNIDPRHMLLTGMSDGGTFTLLSGLQDDSPYTHLAPIAAAFHPLLLCMTEPSRLTGLPIFLLHGGLDWMFPVNVARTANRALSAAGAAVAYREIADLSHAYPRDQQGAILDWLLGPKPAAI